MAVADVPVRCGRPCDHTARVPAVCFVCLEVPQFRFIDRVADFPSYDTENRYAGANCAEDREDPSVQFFGQVADARCCVTTGVGDGCAALRDSTGAVLGQVVRARVQRQVLGMVQTVQKRRVAAVAVSRLVVQRQPGVNVAMMRSNGVWKAFRRMLRHFSRSVLMDIERSHL